MNTRIMAAADDRRYGAMTATALSAPSGCDCPVCAHLTMRDTVLDTIYRAHQRQHVGVHSGTTIGRAVAALILAKTYAEAIDPTGGDAVDAVQGPLIDGITELLDKLTSAIETDERIGTELAEATRHYRYNPRMAPAHLRDEED